MRVRLSQANQFLLERSFSDNPKHAEAANFAFGGTNEIELQSKFVLTVSRQIRYCDHSA
jgi:hypothetical protein